MESQKNIFFPELDALLLKIQTELLTKERRAVLEPLINYIQSKLDLGQVPNLNFICTHNSRRSQFSQIWAQTAAAYFGIPANCMSGGVEITAFNERAVASLKRFGFRISATGEENPIYSISFSSESDPIKAFSKLFDDPVNAAEQFAAVMTCAHADENCPFIPGTEKRIAIRYEDPKAFDDTPQESEMYDRRSFQIAAEMAFVFSKITAKQ